MAAVFYFKKYSCGVSKLMLFLGQNIVLSIFSLSNSTRNVLHPNFQPGFLKKKIPVDCTDNSFPPPLPFHTSLAVFLQKTLIEGSKQNHIVNYVNIIQIPTCIIQVQRRVYYTCYACSNCKCLRKLLNRNSQNMFWGKLDPKRPVKCENFFKHS